MANSKNQIVFKVVREIGKKYYSCLGKYYPKGYNLKYELNKTISAKSHTMGILVFRECGPARKFLDSNRDGSIPSRILRCKTKSLKRNVIKWTAYISFLEEFYLDRKNKKAIHDYNFAPPGTYACKSLIPIEVME